MVNGAKCVAYYVTYTDRRSRAHHTHIHICTTTKHHQCFTGMVYVVDEIDYNFNDATAFNVF